MASRIIINNNTDLSDENVLRYVKDVVSQGKISDTKRGKQYCFCTTYKMGAGKLIILATKRGKSDSFNLIVE